MDLFSLGVGFLIGTATGAAGHYFGEKFTDKRRTKEGVESINERYKDLEERFPEIVEEMRKDVKNEKYKGVREFFVKRKNTSVMSSGPRFEYYPEEHEEIFAAVAHLERLGLIEDITPGNCPMYRMTEEFIDFLRNT